MSWKLRYSDIMRDGGSYEAVLECGEEVVTFFLQVNRWEAPSERAYEEPLQAFPGRHWTPNGRHPEAGMSPEDERLWFTHLLACDTSQATHDAQVRFGEMLAILRVRWDSKGRAGASLDGQ